MIQPKILYEDTDIIAVNKPAGFLTHGDGKTKEKTLSDWLVKKFPEAKSVGEVMIFGDDDIDRSGIVHRLDKETSGVILLAKTQKGFENLKKQFKNREIKKTYHAFLVGTPKESRGIIDKPISKSKSDFRVRSASRLVSSNAREAQTQYVVKESNGKFSFVQAMPKTGRTHQIRVHFKSIGHPVVADSLYGLKDQTEKNSLGFKRTALHSFSIEFKNCSGEIVRVEAPYPDDFEKALKRFSK